MVNKISKEHAENEFSSFVHAMDIDDDVSLMDSEDLASFNRQKSRIVKAIMNGSLIFNDSGEAVFTPQHERTKHKDPVTFRERTGASLMAMDGKKKGHDVAKTYAVMADMCGVHAGVFSGMVGSDVKICEALFAILMD